MKKPSDYVSEIDQCIQELDQQHPELSPSQRKEQLKYARIYQLRDHNSGETAKKVALLWF